jgi:photosystem II stability/assembly factor-like uncharacterized protein
MQLLNKNTVFLLLLLVNFQSLSAQLMPTPAADRLAALARHRQLDAASAVPDIRFRNIGPTAMSGRVVDLEVNPADPTEFYLAFASGGLWHTVNNGQSFVPIFDQEDAMSIGDIAVNWKDRLIWVGTGEANSSRSSYSGIGVYKSADNGKNWSYLGLPESHHIGEIILHPTNKDIAWVAAAGHLYSANPERGVYKTTDGGAQWKQTLYIDDNTGAIEMDINPANPDVLYACMWHRTRRAWDWKESGASSGIYKSTDGGERWTLLSTPASGLPAGPGFGRSGIAVFAGNPSILYAVVDNNALKPDTAKVKKDSSKYVTEDFKTMTKEKFAALNVKKLDSFLLKNRFPAKYKAKDIIELVKTDKLQPTVLYDWLVADDGFQNAGIKGCEVYRSDDAGATWKKVNTKEITVFSTYGYYFGKIFVSPVNENKVITFGTSLVLSTDGGKTFSGVDKGNTHGDWHGCWINPARDNHWIAANDGGANITYDNGKKWFKVTNIPAGQFYAITTDDARPYRVYGGLQDNGVWVGASATGDDGASFSFAEETEAEPEDYDWKAIGGGDGMQVQVDTRDNKTAYFGSQFGYYQRHNPDNGKRLSIHPMHDLGEAKLRYNWQTPILLSKHNSDIFYFGTNKLHRSLNKGENLTAISPDLTNGKKPGKIPYGTITTIAESPLKFGLLYVGTDDGNVQVSRDGGYTWTLITKGLPAQLWVSRVTPSAHQEGRVYVTLNGYRYDNFNAWLFVSEDYGNTWTALGNDLPAEPLNVVTEDVMNENILYVGSDNGLYYSFNRGNSFMGFGKAFPRVAVHDLCIQKRENELVVGTHGRSIYITKLALIQKAYDSLQRKKGAPLPGKAGAGLRLRNTRQADKAVNHHSGYVGHGAMFVKDNTLAPGKSEPVSSECQRAPGKSVSGTTDRYTGLSSMDCG